MTVLLAICVGLLGLSEALAYVPSIKANSAFQMIVNVIGMIKTALLPK